MKEAKKGLTRRRFLEGVGLAGGSAALYETMTALGLINLPEAWAGPPQLPQGSGTGKTVVILGAGIGGLTAAYELSRARYQCQIIELTDRAGGRNHTARRGTVLVEQNQKGETLKQVCNFDEGLYLNLGPGRLPYHHRRVLHYCQELGVALEIYVMETMANLFQSDKAFGGKSQIRRRIANDIQGYISEMLAKAVNQNALNPELDEGDRNNLLCLLKNFGDLGENDTCSSCGQTKCKNCNATSCADCAGCDKECATCFQYTGSTRDGCEITVYEPCEPVFCATELHVGRHIFFSRDFVYTKDFGLGVPGFLKIGDAVQLSANFPGGFPFRRFPVKGFRFARTKERSKFLVLTDGGVYDNTATAWYLDPEVFQIKQQQTTDKLLREAKLELEAALANKSMEEMKAGELLSLLRELSPPFHRHLEQRLQEVDQEYKGKVNIPDLLQLANSDSLAVSPEAVQSILDELADKSYDLIVINAAYPPLIQRANLVSLPVVSDLLTFTKTTETLYNNDNHQRLTDLRRLFINKTAQGALVSIEEHPEQLATYLSNPEKWFSGKLPEEEIELRGQEAESRSRWVHEILSFYAKSEHPQDNAVPVEITNRARKALEHLHPGYQHNGVVSPQERARLNELSAKVRRLGQELKHNNDVLNGQPEESVARAEQAQKILKLEMLLNEASSDRTLLILEINLRRMNRTLEELPLTAELHRTRQANQKVATTLRPLGVETTANLLYQGYLGAMMNFHALMSDYPLMRTRRLEHFKSLVSGREVRPEEPTAVSQSDIDPRA